MDVNTVSLNLDSQPRHLLLIRFSKHWRFDKRNQAKTKIIVQHERFDMYLLKNKINAFVMWGRNQPYFGLYTDAFVNILCFTKQY